MKELEYKMPSYINDWILIIEQMVNSNTYKPCFGRAILECINDNDFIENSDYYVININEISKNMFKYYWNQMFFFNLKQSPSGSGEPVICQKVRDAINLYKEKKENNFPIAFNNQTKDHIINIIGINYYNKKIHLISKDIPNNVLFRFKRVSNKILDIYKIDSSNENIYFDKNDIILLKTFNVILSKLLNYKWAQLLEKYNIAPKIVNKIQCAAANKINRNNLTKYKNELIKQFDDGRIIDFYSHEEISYEEATVDHVIPWSFMYSDDIWNLVLTTRSNNSIKSNTIPEPEDIIRLKERNNILINKLEGKFKEDLLESEKESLVDKCYYECKI